MSEQERQYEEALAALSGRGSLQRDALLLAEVRKINGTVKRHNAILFGHDDDAGDNGVVPDIRANTEFRKNLTLGSKIVRVMLPPALIGGLVALARSGADLLGLLFK